MKYRDRNGYEVSGNAKQDIALGILYGTVIGRLVLKPVVQPAVSRMFGCLLNTRISSYAAKFIIKKHGIVMEDYTEQSFSSYNAFFHRKIIPEKRPVVQEDKILISPCDGKLICCPVSSKSRFVIKHGVYTLHSLLRNRKIADRFEGGMLLIFRLTVDDYHRYCYIADGKKTKNIHIPGVLHSVNPAAIDVISVYKENTREYSLLKTKEFGTVLMMEVGALFVGKINNHHEDEYVRRGMEKGYFEFGGSTIILCFEKDRIEMDSDIIKNSTETVETLVRQGERIGSAVENISSEAEATYDRSIEALCRDRGITLAE